MLNYYSGFFYHGAFVESVTEMKCMFYISVYIYNILLKMLLVNIYYMFFEEN